MKRLLTLLGAAMLIAAALVMGPTSPAYAVGDSDTSLHGGVYLANPGQFDDPVTQATYGTNLEFIAVVLEDCGALESCDAPTGTATFKEGAVTVATTNFVVVSSLSSHANVQSSALAAGVHSIGVEYSGDDDFAANSASLDDQPLTITQAQTLTTLTSSDNPSTAGAGVILKAQVTPRSTIDTAHGALLPSGSVTFFEGTRDLGFGTVDNQGEATLATADLSVGTQSLTARYNGNVNYAGSTSEVLPQTVNKATTTTSISASPASSVFGQTVNLIATVSPNSATGTVTFFENGAGIGTVTLANGVAGLGLTPSVGSHQYSATYNGSGSHTGSSTTQPATVTVAKANTTTALIASSATTNLGQPVTFTATVSPTAPGAGTPTGTVQFKDGASPLGAPVPLSGPTATLTTSSLGAGVHTITAVYSGDGNFNGSTSPAVTETITCTTNYTSTVAGNITASPTGTTCFNNARIGGSIMIPAGATVSIVNSTVGGAVQSMGGAAGITICGSTLGSVSIAGATRAVTVGDPNTACSGNNIKGSIQVSSNTGGVTIGGNTVAGWIQCNGNSPAPTNGGRLNAAGGRAGQCAGAF